MGEEALVDGQHPFSLDSFEHAVHYAVVEIARLVVHAGHNGIFFQRVSIPESAAKCKVGA